MQQPSTVDFKPVDYSALAQQTFGTCDFDMPSDNDYEWTPFNGVSIGGGGGKKRGECKNSRGSGRGALLGLSQSVLGPSHQAQQQTTQEQHYHQQTHQSQQHQPGHPTAHQPTTSQAAAMLSQQLMQLHPAALSGLSAAQLAAMHQHKALQAQAQAKEQAQAQAQAVAAQQAGLAAAAAAHAQPQMSQMSFAQHLVTAQQHPYHETVVSVAPSSSQTGDHPYLTWPIQQPAINMPFFDMHAYKHVNLDVSPSENSQGQDLPLNDVSTLRFFFNLGIQQSRVVLLNQHLNQHLSSTSQGSNFGALLGLSQSVLGPSHQAQQQTTQEQHYHQQTHQSQQHQPGHPTAHQPTTSQAAAMLSQQLMQLHPAALSGLSAAQLAAMHQHKALQAGRSRKRDLPKVDDRLHKKNGTRVKKRRERTPEEDPESSAEPDTVDIESMEEFVCKWATCGKEFTTKQPFYDHVETIHVNPSIEHICEWEDCERKKKPFEANHMNTVAPRVLKITNYFTPAKKPYKCTECGQAFSNSSDRAKHQNRTHSDEKPYLCDYQGCPKAYTDPSSLGTHIKSTHGDDVFKTLRQRNLDEYGGRWPKTSKKANCVSTETSRKLILSNARWMRKMQVIVKRRGKEQKGQKGKKAGRAKGKKRKGSTTLAPFHHPTMTMKYLIHEQSKIKERIHLLYHHVYSIEASRPLWSQFQLEEAAILC
ncbi:unnamed protein product, partial [Mesorhabditis belari]|uniref:C2H2-type domain-containing protein n=1 Tax=Mesorhabditis belari TaxID=2138241 RepID=A0AAF3EHT5_9BILA